MIIFRDYYLYPLKFLQELRQYSISIVKKMDSDHKKKKCIYLAQSLFVSADSIQTKETADHQKWIR